MTLSWPTSSWWLAFKEVEAAHAAHTQPRRRSLGKGLALFTGESGHAPRPRGGRGRGADGSEEAKGRRGAHRLGQDEDGRAPREVRRSLRRRDDVAQRGVPSEEDRL